MWQGPVQERSASPCLLLCDTVRGLVQPQASVDMRQFRKTLSHILSESLSE